MSFIGNSPSNSCLEPLEDWKCEQTQTSQNTTYNQSSKSGNINNNNRCGIGSKVQIIAPPLNTWDWFQDSNNSSSPTHGIGSKVQILLCI